MEKRKLRKFEHELMCFNVSAGVLQTLQTHNKWWYMRQAFVTRDAPIDQSAIIIIMRWYSVIGRSAGGAKKGQSEPPIRCRKARPFNLLFTALTGFFSFLFLFLVFLSLRLHKKLFHFPTRKPVTKTNRAVQQLNGGGSEPIVRLQVGHVVCRACVTVDRWKACLAVAGWRGIWGSKSWTALGEVWISSRWKLRYYMIIFCK